MIKKILLEKTPLKRYREKGFLAKNVRRQLLINFIFQRLLGLNRECKHSVHFTSTVQNPQNLKIGKGVEISLLISGSCYIQATNGISIGDGTIFANGVKIISSNHNFHNLKTHLSSPPIKIGDNCWLGANSIILPGITIGDNTIIGAGTVVTKSFPEGNIILVGNPAKILRRI